MNERRPQSWLGRRILLWWVGTSLGIMTLLVAYIDRSLAGLADGSQETIDQIRVRMWFGFAAAIAVGAATMVVASRRISRPLSALVFEVETALGLRAQSKTASSMLPEADRLESAFRLLSDDLSAARQQTEGRVAALHAVLGALPQGATLIESDDTIGYMSPRHLEFFGHGARNVGELTPMALQGMVRLARGGSTVDEVIAHGTPPRMIRTTALALEDRGRVLLLSSDVTDATRMEAMRRDFVADASHELKTPISVIIAAIETLQLALDSRPEEVRRFAVQVEASARTLNRIVSDLFDLSRIESGGSPRDRVDFGLVVGEEVERMKTRAEAAGIAISVDLVPAIVLGSASDLALAVRNLCENALRYTDRGGSIAIRMRQESDRAILTVADTGAGIPQREIPRIFERFYRVDAARSRATGGTGLGLAIVKHAVEQHRGMVVVSSELGVGSVFTLNLPLAPPAPGSVEGGG